MGCFYFLASFLFTSCLVLGAEPPTKYVLKGTGESLKPTFSGQPNSILWKHNGNKVVEFDSREEQVYGAYKNRITLDWVSAELEITGLKFEDRGLYEVEVDINNMLHLSEFKLEVIDKVAMPTISCEINKDGGSDVSEVRATLLCSADPTPPESMMKFEWRARGKSQPGHKFNISLGDERDNEEYRCSVSNPVSSETATFTAKYCYHVLGAEPPTKYVLKGTGESLKPTFSGQPNSILWKHNGNKVVEFDSREQKVYGAYKNRITLDWATAELEIRGLKFEDRGLYEVEVDINNMLHLSEFKLEVIDKVAMPTISCEINKDGGSDVSEVRATLLCSADPTPPESMMKFEWRARGKSQPGHKFNISLGDERDNEEYNCSVSNPVSSETATFTAKDCYHVLGAEPPTKYVLKGTGESLKPTFSGQPNSILWKHNGNKVVEFDSREQEVYGAYKNRITLDWVSAELEITGLKFEDRGLYEVEVDINNMLHLSQFKLEVIDKVAMPTISCELNKDGGSDVSEVRATLLCSADPTPPESMMKFEWRARGKSQPGHKFNISLGDERDNEEYSCSVSNPVSSETATFTAKDCYHVLGAEPPTKYVLKGTGESLKPTFSGQPNSILWKHNGNKVVEFDSREEQVYGAYKNRITLDWVSAELEITGLKLEDRGLYEVEVDINNMLHLSEFKLEVIDKVAMPTISCEINKDGGSDVSEVRATLLCSADPTPPESMMKFEWRARGKSQPGHKFNISLGDERDNEEYSCSVSNPVSSETATFTAKDCYHGAELPTKYVLKGTGESLKPTFSGQPNSILWRHNGNKVVEFDSREQKVYGAYKNRITLDWVSAELEITGLKFEDRGLYEVEVDIDNIFYLSEFKLEVIDKVAMPTISCEINKDGGSDVSEVRATLLCSADPTPPESMMKFKWRARGKSQPGHKFNIPLGDERDNEEYRCSVSNPVSSETATFTAKDCYHDNSSVAVAVSLAVSLAISLAVVGLIVLVMIIFFCKKRQKACFAKGQQDEEEKQTEGSDKKKAQGGETRHLLAETLLSDQPLNVSYSPVNVKKMAGEINRRAGQEPVGDKKPRKGNLKEKEDNIEKGEKPQQTKNITEPEKNQGGGEEASPVPPTDQTSPTLANSSPPKTERGPDEDPEDPAGGQKNGSDSDEDYEDTQDESVSQTDSSGTQQNRNESDKSSVNKSSSVPHEEGSNTTSQERESATPKEEESTEEAKPVKPVPPAEETSNLMSNGEEIDEKQHLADSTEVNTSNTLTLRLQTLHMQIQSLRGRAGRTQVRGGGQAEADQGEGGNDEDKEEDQGGPEDEKSDDEW
ncbi:titin isoform X2 [Labrus bergylta]|uniref:titin isoform X2 n=1 Tax=Labrus bergylta TaxID=56723 RepID=UPI00331425DD